MAQIRELAKDVNRVLREQRKWLRAEGRDANDGKPTPRRKASRFVSYPTDAACCAPNVGVSCNSKNYLIDDRFANLDPS